MVRVNTRIEKGQKGRGKLEAVNQERCGDEMWNKDGVARKDRWGRRGLAGGTVCSIGQ